MKRFKNRAAYVYTILLVVSSPALLAIEPADPLSSEQSPHFAAVSPWISSIRILRHGVHKHNCGASLIDRRWVLTGRHCVRKRQCKSGKPGTLEVWIGPNSDEDPVVRYAEKISCYPPVNHRDKWRNDIALIRISEEVELDDQQLPALASSTPATETAVAVGWVDDLAHTAELKRPTGDDCTAYLSAHRKRNECGKVSRLPEQICAGSTDSDREGLHRGDSGGPLLRLNGGRAELIGVASKACTGNLLSIFEDVSLYKDWIVKKICKYYLEEEGEASAQRCRQRFR